MNELRDLRERIEALERRKSPPWWPAAVTAVVAVLALSLQVVPWIADKFSTTPDVELSNASASTIQRVVEVVDPSQPAEGSNVKYAKDYAVLSEGEGTGALTVTGGTGRFADASGTSTLPTVKSTIVSTVGTIVTTHDTNTIEGRISY